MRILHLNTDDRLGGAARIARTLFQARRTAGADDAWWVRRTQAREPGIASIGPGVGGLAETVSDRGMAAWARMRAPMVVRQAWKHGFSPLIDPGRMLAHWRAEEPFAYPGFAKRWTRDHRFDLVHAHNLHGHWFDLRELPSITAVAPLLITLHDSWLFAGHCCHPLACEGWRRGCPSCPQLDLSYPIRRDNAAANWSRKAAIYRAAKSVHLVAPSRWLLERASASVLREAPGIRRVIANGVDLDVFRPGDRAAARERFSVAGDGIVFMAAADGIRSNPYKDWSLLEAVMRRPGVAPCTLLALGGRVQSEERWGAVRVRHLPYSDDRGWLADAYRAADVVVHPARMETFPNVVIESLACATPVVATAVGGIIEQIRPARIPGGVGDIVDDALATGVLVPVGDAQALATVLDNVVDNRLRLRRFGDNGARDARHRFDARRMIAAYDQLYGELVGTMEAVRNDPA